MSAKPTEGMVARLSCPTCGCRLHTESGPCHGTALLAKVRKDMEHWTELAEVLTLLGMGMERNAENCRRFAAESAEILRKIDAE